MKVVYLLFFHVVLTMPVFFRRGKYLFVLGNSLIRLITIYQGLYKLFFVYQLRFFLVCICFLIFYPSEFFQYMLGCSICFLMLRQTNCLIPSCLLGKGFCLQLIL